MAAKKTMAEPLHGTHATDMTTSEDISVPTKKGSGKKPTSFNIDPELLIQFKAGCVHHGRPMSSVIEEMMLQFLSKIKC